MKLDPAPLEKALAKLEQRHSDLDLVVMTERPLDVFVPAGMNAAFSDSALPITVDVLDWASLETGFRDLIRGGSVIIQESASPQA